MTVSVGDKVPAATLTRMTSDGPRPLQTQDFFKDRTVALFAVPGAFTPTCSAKHLPGFVDKADELKAKGVDEIACVSVNDTFVMDAWGTKRRRGQDHDARRRQWRVRRGPRPDDGRIGLRNGQARPTVQYDRQER